MIEDIIIDFFNDSEQDKKQNIKEYILGIDLGTSYSCAAIWEDNTYKMIKNKDNNILFPSIVSFDDKDNLYTCNNAIKHIEHNNYFYEVKRLIGRDYSDTIIQNEKSLLTYNIKESKNNNIIIEKEYKNKIISLTPEEVSSYILYDIKKTSEDFLNTSISKCIITVPAYFNDRQRQATRDAAEIAGLDCLMILSEPIASAYAYGIITKQDYNILVYDIGGGTLDISLLNISDNVFEVLATSGNIHIGGYDFDKIIYEYCLNIFIANNKDIKNIDNLNNNIDNYKKK